MILTYLISSDVFSVYHGKSYRFTGKLLKKRVLYMIASLIFQKIHTVYEQIMSDIQ